MIHGFYFDGIVWFFMVCTPLPCSLPSPFSPPSPPLLLSFGGSFLGVVFCLPFVPLHVPFPPFLPPLAPPLLSPDCHKLMILFDLLFLAFHRVEYVGNGVENRLINRLQTCDRDSSGRRGGCLGGPK